MAIYNGNQKVKPSGIKNVYFGTQRVYRQLAIYTVVGTTTNATINGASSYGGTIQEGGTLTLTLGADGTSYKLPQSVSVSGATGTFTRTSDTVGTLVISNPTGNVSFSVVGEQARLTDLAGTNWQFNSVPVINSSLTLDGMGIIVYSGTRNFNAYTGAQIFILLRSDGATFLFLNKNPSLGPSNEELFAYESTTGKWTYILGNNSYEVSPPVIKFCPSSSYSSANTTNTQLINFMYANATQI